MKVSEKRKVLIRRLLNMGIEQEDVILIVCNVIEDSDVMGLMTWMDENPKVPPKEIFKKSIHIAVGYKG